MIALHRNQNDTRMNEGKTSFSLSHSRLRLLLVLSQPTSCARYTIHSLAGIRGPSALLGFFKVSPP